VLAQAGEMPSWSYYNTGEPSHPELSRATRSRRNRHNPVSGHSDSKCEFLMLLDGVLSRITVTPSRGKAVECRSPLPICAHVDSESMTRTPITVQSPGGSYHGQTQQF
jgi:hypothetical protein